eukprot:TRINITY_DN61214_c0_g1_i1.p1 TRINITY_DN61214_c0_g1~~TRINITY_DN61214_c0_g1_i1.p1  ORF type:complete len:360 (+),score=96.06 TRINITY_DN61214_c0_g1_i1:77-1081(+)
MPADKLVRFGRGPEGEQPLWFPPPHTEDGVSACIPLSVPASAADQVADVAYKFKTSSPQWFVVHPAHLGLLRPGETRDITIIYRPKRAGPAEGAGAQGTERFQLEAHGLSAVESANARGSTEVLRAVFKRPPTEHHHRELLYCHFGKDPPPTGWAPADAGGSRAAPSAGARGAAFLSPAPRARADSTPGRREPPSASAARQESGLRQRSAPRQAGGGGSGGDSAERDLQWELGDLRSQTTSLEEKRQSCHRGKTRRRRLLMLLTLVLMVAAFWAGQRLREAAIEAAQREDAERREALARRRQQARSSWIPRFLRSRPPSPPPPEPQQPASSWFG